MDGLWEFSEENITKPSVDALDLKPIPPEENVWEKILRNGSNQIDDAMMAKDVIDIRTQEELNYVLTALSPCINAGLTISTMKQDIVECSLPQGSSTDVGPIEFVVNTQKAAFGSMDETNSIEPLITKDFNMYPNPSMGAVNIDFSGNLDANVSRVRIINLNGKLEYEEVYSENVDKILINHNLMDGMYVLQVIFEDGLQTTKKLIVRTP
jgi:hypothetical protein